MSASTGEGRRKAALALACGLWVAAASGCGRFDGFIHPGPPAGGPECADGVDNDGDTFTDLADPQCASRNDNDEAS